MLVVIIIWLGCRALFLRSLSSDEDFAFTFFFKTLLVMALRSNQETDVVNTRVLWDIYLLFNFGMVLQGIQNCGIEILHQGLVSYCHELVVEGSVVLVHNYFRLDKLLKLLFGGVSPLVCMLARSWMSAREIDVIFICCDSDERIELRHGVLHLLCGFLEFFQS